MNNEETIWLAESIEELATCILQIKGGEFINPVLSKECKIKITELFDSDGNITESQITFA